MTLRIFALLLCALPVAAQPPTTWHFDNLTRIGGAGVTLLGAPKVVDTPLGKAIHFTGTRTAGDALYIDANPLEGTLPYTIELIFRPSSAGTDEQRFFHIQESASQSRRMFELRVHEGRWCLDTVAFTYPPSVQGQAPPARSGVMLTCDAAHLFSLDQWHAIAAVYDGHILRAYVDGIFQGEIAVELLPLGPGHTSVGTRYDKRDYFTGDVLEARFHHRALTPAELMHVPAQQLQ